MRTRTITKSSMSSLFVFHTLSNDVSCGIRWLFPMNLTNLHIRNGFCWFHHWQWDQFSSEYYRIFAAPKEFVASWPKKKCVIQSNTREKSEWFFFEIFLLFEIHKKRFSSIPIHRCQIYSPSASPIEMYIAQWTARMREEKNAEDSRRRSNVCSFIKSLLGFNGFPLLLPLLNYFIILQ